MSGEESEVWEGISLAKSAALAFERAEGEASARGHTYLGIEHLLLGILSEQDGEATDLFQFLAVDRETMRRTIVEEIG